MPDLELIWLAWCWLMNDSWKNKIQDAAQRYSADPERAWVWEIFSQVYLDTEHSDSQLQDMAESLSASKFSISELAHIAFHEVNPVCIWNVFYWEWGGFNADWLFPRCLKNQRRHPYKVRSAPDEIPFFMTVLAGFWLEPSQLVDRVRLIRTSSQAVQ